MIIENSNLKDENINTQGRWIKIAELLVKVAVKRGVKLIRYSSEEFPSKIAIEGILKILSEPPFGIENPINIDQKKISKLLSALNNVEILNTIYMMGQLLENSSTDTCKDKKIKFYTLAAELGHFQSNIQLEYFYKKRKSLSDFTFLKISMGLGSRSYLLKNDSKEKPYDLAIHHMRSGDYDNAIKHFLDSVAKGNEEAIPKLAICYEKSTPNNYNNAFLLYLKLADKGDVNALYHLALYYDYGYGVDEDKNLAALLYQQAAQKGHALAKAKIHLLKQGEILAILEVADRFERGDRLPQDNNQAINLYKQAAEEGSLKAIYKLSQLSDESNKG